MKMENLEIVFNIKHYKLTFIKDYPQYHISIYLCLDDNS